MCKIYHIVHVDRLQSIINSQGIFSDAIIRQGNFQGSTIGMDTIKDRRLYECELSSHPNLYVGECVPFYFCPRSVMLYMMHRNNSQLSYSGGQEPIIHLVSNLQTSIDYADGNNLRWAVTSSNAGSRWFEDFANLNDLSKLNWNAINARYWNDCREAKQAEFLIEKCFHWNLIESIGVYDDKIYGEVSRAINQSSHTPKIEVKREWYY